MEFIQRLTCNKGDAKNALPETFDRIWPNTQPF